ncbi:hypothetical protein ZYGR_0I07940 [Zygosaccharomyces rouxii]|uniref:DUF676 domain-containing protein n=1 Tax=Zygosaccharomyces rouxii TaxID=4956 RepID=A0A1Q2ZYE0_ZYGRO|nr:hypothetical protein ZYGR_0I07940 [Zygosaccharomyces rouxii]
MTCFKSLLHSYYLPFALFSSTNGTRKHSQPVKPIEPNDEDVYFDSFPPKDHYQVPKNPIVLCHGLSGFDKIILIPSIYQLTKIIRQSIMANNSEHFIETEDQPTGNGFLEIEYWIGVKEKLEKKGCTVLVTKVPSFGSIEERALSLHSFLEKETQNLRHTATKNEIYNVKGDDTASSIVPGPIKLNLIAHSMGGLDCRFLISKIKNKNYQVLSLTTVSTPHHGSEMADYVVNLIQDLKKLAPSEPEKLILPPSIHELTTKYMSFFNATTPNDPTVSYFSYGSCFSPRWFNTFYMTWKIIHNLSGGQPNDGMVTVQSSKWGHFRGCLLDTDHLDIINWKNKLQRDFSKSVFNASKAASQSLRPDIDILNFYLYIADDLARRGF